MIRLLSRRSRHGLVAAAFAAGLATLPAVPATAATLSLVGGTTTTLPTGCSTGAFNPVNFCSSNAAKTTYVGLDPDAVMRPGSTVTKISATAKNANPSYGLVLDGKARVTFTYMLKEAAYTNVLAETTAGWNQMFNTASTAIGTQSASVVMGPGLLAFTLKTLGASARLRQRRRGAGQGRPRLQLDLQQRPLGHRRLRRLGRRAGQATMTTSSPASTWRRSRCRPLPGCSSPASAASASPPVAGLPGPEHLQGPVPRSGTGQSRSGRAGAGVTTAPFTGSGPIAHATRLLPRLPSS